MPVHIHIAEQLKEVEACRASTGRRPIELLLETGLVNERWCLVHATHATPAELEGIAAARAAVCVSISTEANLGDGFFDAARFLESKRPPLHRLRQSGDRMPRGRAALDGVSGAPAQTPPRRARGIERAARRHPPVARGCASRGGGLGSTRRSHCARARAPIGWCSIPSTPAWPAHAQTTALDHLDLRRRQRRHPRRDGRRALGGEGSTARGGGAARGPFQGADGAAGARGRLSGAAASPTSTRRFRPWETQDRRRSTGSDAGECGLRALDPVGMRQPCFARHVEFAGAQSAAVVIVVLLGQRLQGVPSVGNDAQGGARGEAGGGEHAIVVFPVLEIHLEIIRGREPLRAQPGMVPVTAALSRTLAAARHPRLTVPVYTG